MMLRRKTRRWAFIVNSTAGRGKTGRKISKLVNTLNEQGFQFDLEITKAPRHAIELTRELIKNGYRRLVAVGGDGTVNEVVNGIMLSRKAADIRLGLIPEGGGNDFSRNFRIPGDIDRAVKILKEENFIPVDVGKIEDFYFINALGIGFDAKVAEYADKIRYLNGLPRYFLALLQALLKLKPHHLYIKLNDELMDISTLLISVGNGLSTGGGFLLTPQALVNDGKFDICIISEVKLLRLLRLLPTVLTGKHVEQPEVRIIHTDLLQITSDKKLPIYYDGELPELKNPYEFTIRLLPGAINFICRKGFSTNELA
ncbi:MAG: diacylglycerol kinase family lipid kinase [Candidatus Cloacimonetes bacterium]|nr:diacylglycerol kinase family lipid kinase [Candidatus Cloacimonadota bacterium]